MAATGREAAASGTREAAASFQAGLGFDTTGVRAEPLRIVLRGFQEPVVPDSMKTRPEIVRLVQKRDEAKREVARLTAELATMPRRSGEDQVRVAKKREELDQAQNRKLFYDFSVKEAVDALQGGGEQLPPIGPANPGPAD
ncbi:MAG: hypothetical protein HYY85_20620 [Deltaproteobacteria bacterium]|nr:hypothetical protein [Deltaproteobacteria bacterium]